MAWSLLVVHNYAVIKEYNVKVDNYGKKELFGIVSIQQAHSLLLLSWRNYPYGREYIQDKA